MKKIFMTGSCLALALTSFSAYAVDSKPSIEDDLSGIAYSDDAILETVPEDSAADFKVFIGGNIALSGVAYSHDAKTATEDIGVKLPESFFGGGIEVGIKFPQIERVHIAGLTFAYDYAFDSEADIEPFAEDYISCINTGFSAWSITFDNYLRVSGDAKHRQDIVLGVGLGRATERVEMQVTYLGTTYGLYDIDETDNGRAVIFKVGYNYNISEHADWFLNGRFFVPSKYETDVDVLFNMSAGLRYIF